MAIQLSGSLAITGSLIATSQIVAQTLSVQQVTSSIVYSSGSNIFGNSTSNTQQFTGSLQVSSSTSYILGNVGIGTTSPTVNLDIENSSGWAGLDLNGNSGGEIRLQQGGVTYGQIYANSPASSGLVINAAGVGNDIYFQSAGSTKMVMLDSGNVGIGTTSPAYTLNVSKNVAGDYVAEINNTNTTNGFGLRVKGANGTSSYILATNDGTNEVFIVRGDGRVGVGTTSPSQKLHIMSGSVLAEGGGTNNGIIIGAAGNNVGGAIKAKGVTNEMMYFDSTNTVLNGESNIYLRIANSDKVTINSSGNVGIGTTSPSDLLDIYASSGTPAIRLSGAGAGTNTYRITGQLIGVSNTGFGIYDNTNSTYRLVINGSGNVGIGTTSPGNLLHLSSSSTSATGIRFTLGSEARDHYLVSTTPNTSAGRDLGLLSWRGLTLKAGNGTTEGEIYINAYENIYLNTSSSYTTRMFVSSSGVVSIATTSPYTSLSTRLYVGYDQNLSVVNQNEFISVGAAGGSTNSAGINFLIYNGGFGGRIYTDDNASSVRGLAFDVLQSGTFYNAISITRTSSPSVGIGTTSPNSKLDVVGASNNAATYGILTLRNSSDGGLSFGASSTSYAWIQGNVYGTGTAPLVLQANGGNVGIGTTSPDSKFHMAPSNGSQIRFNYAGSGDNYYDGVTHYFRNGNGASNVMTLLSGGNVGIGTTSPLAKLDVRGSGNNQTLAVYQGASGSSAGIYIENTGSISIASARIYLDNLDNFVIGRGGGTDRIGMAISASGAIGINTLPTSTARLVISGSTNVANIQGSGSNIFTVDGTSGRLFSVDDDLTNSLFSVNTIAGLPVIEAFADNTVKLGKYSAVSGSVMNITGSNVGIGTSSPTERLEINGSIRLNDGNADGPQLRLASSGYSDWNIDNFSGNLRAYYGSTEYLRVTSGGDVAIGRTDNGGGRLGVRSSGNTSAANAMYIDNSSSTELFSVRNDGLIRSGVAAASPYNNSTSGRSVVVESGGGLGYTSSTRESKTNINSIESVDWINQLNPVSFNYRKKDNNSNYTDEFYDDKSFGFIADEVESVNSDFVFYNDKQDGTKELAGVKYESMTAILIKAIQELKAEIEVLKNK